jgi:hypothetical protein
MQNEKLAGVASARPFSTKKQGGRRFVRKSNASHTPYEFFFYTSKKCQSLLFSY